MAAMSEATAAAQAARTPSAFSNLKVVLLAGGVGGARLADGLARLIPPHNLTIIVNTGDDFQHMGLTICPDVDTVMYTLAGVANPQTGWGRKGETWTTMRELEQLGGPDWFRLGDLDLATHMLRTQLLAEGKSLTQVTAQLCHQFNVSQTLLPMSNDAAPTMIETDKEMLTFQDWFVRRNWTPAVRRVHLPEEVRAPRPVLLALEQADIVIIAPSNPFVSIDPILNVYPIRAMISDLPQAVVAVSPLIGGKAVKGPAARMMVSLGLQPTAAAIAEYYNEVIDIFVYDRLDRDDFSAGTLPELLCTDIYMKNEPDRARLAHEIMDFTVELIKQ